MVFNSIPVKSIEQTVVFDVAGTVEERSSDSVWIFADGIAPHESLKQIGVGFGLRGLTVDASQEALPAAIVAPVKVTGVRPHARS